MIPLKNLGYREVTVKVRELTLGELKLYILRSFMKHGEREMTLIDISSGDTKTFRKKEDVLEDNWANCKIELINMPHSWGFEDDFKAVIIFQIAEEDSDKIIK